MRINLPLEKFSIPRDFKKLMGLSGVYFLIFDGEIEYIGRSVNVGNRLTSHRVFDRDHHTEVWVYIIPINNCSWGAMHKQKVLELELIHAVNPSKNIVGAKDENGC